MSLAAGPTEVAPGVHRVPLPLPFPPREVAAWVIEGEGGEHTLVDTGIDTAEARAALRGGARALGVTPESLAWVVITHVHIDHYGLAGPVRSWGRARVALHEREEELARRFVDRWPQDRAGVGEGLRAAGAPAEAVPGLLGASDRIHRLYRDFRPDLLLRGESGPLPGGGGWEWRLTPGHSPGHVVVHHPERRILIAGDHVLPRISPNIGADLYARDPLSDYLASLRALRSLPVELVLPSHGEPFHDLAGRVDAILAHHAERLDGLAGLLERPATAWELTGRLFGPMASDLLLHAFRETVAHLVYLERAGRAVRETGELERWRRA